MFEKKKTKSNSNLYSGGDGSSEQNAVIITADDSWKGVSAEYDYIELLHGAEGTGWELAYQMKYDVDSSSYDVLEVRFPDGTEKKFYFDITSFYGKF